MPESGTLLSDVTNTVGVIAKDTLGVGFGNISGKIVDSKNNFITDFKLNKLGIGRFTLKPKLDESYTAVLENQTSYKTNLNANSIGIILKLVNHDTHAILSIVTNSNLPENVRKSPLYLLIHNGKKFNKFKIDLNDKNEFSQKIDFNSLDTGTQIITLFNEYYKPIAERLFFNHQGLDILNKSEVSKILKKTVFLLT
ncbi:MAG: hypothetical protein HC798_01530 [Polaribacter sp.]|nr:hypothetical protein [Polaribacter sp.]